MEVNISMIENERGNSDFVLMDSRTETKRNGKLKFTQSGTRQEAAESHDHSCTERTLLIKEELTMVSK